MLNQVITVGDKLNIRQFYSDHRVSDVYASKLLDISSENNISIAMPIEQGKVIVMDLEAVYEVVFYTAKGLFVCKAQVSRRFKSQNIYVAVLKPLTEVKKIQRREYYRFDCIIEMKYWTVSPDMIQTNDNIKAIQLNLSNANAQQINRLAELEARMERMMEAQNKEKPRQGFVTDISGGGIKFTSREDTEKGTLIYLEFMLGGVSTKKIGVYGSIVGCAQTDLRKDLYEHRVKFLNIGDEEREHIVRYIFEEERKIRHKEKGFN